MVAAETVKHRLGLEPVWLGLKPSQIPQYLVSGSSEAQVLDVSWQKEFSERQSGREEVALFRYGEHTPHRAGPSQRVGAATKCGLAGFHRLGEFTCQ